MLTHMTILQPDAIDKMEPFGKIISNVTLLNIFLKTYNFFQKTIRAY